MTGYGHAIFFNIFEDKVPNDGIVRLFLAIRKLHGA